MFEKLRSLLFEPHYPPRYIGRHRLPTGQPGFTMSPGRSLTGRNA